MGKKSTQVRAEDYPTPEKYLDGAPIRFLVTSFDVIHSWAIPSLGLKTDATPGRLNKMHCFIQREGVFYGQCSELCGALHGYMPICVEAVSPETYAAHAKKYYQN